MHENIRFGLGGGGPLAIETTLCRGAHDLHQPIAFDHASTHPVYKDHITPRLYEIECYISLPIVTPDGVYFGKLCAVDPRSSAAKGTWFLAQVPTL